MVWICYIFFNHLPLFIDSFDTRKTDPPSSRGGTENRLEDSIIMLLPTRAFFSLVKMRLMDWIVFSYINRRASLVAQRVKCLPAMQETWVRSLGREDPWRRKWQPLPVLLPGKSNGQRSLVGCSPWGHKESDMTEWLHFNYINRGCQISLE